MTFWETIVRGEYVMFALCVIIVLTVVTVWAKCAGLRRGGRKTTTLMHKVKDYVVEGDMENARQLAAATPTPGGRIVAGGLDSIGEPIVEIKERLQSTVSREKETIGSSSIIWLRTYAIVAPLLGLGGTLTGVIDRLRDLGESGVAVDSGMICSEIAPTIVSTVAGLGTGIIALLGLAIVEGAINRARKGMDKVGEEFMGLINQPTS